MLPNPLMNISCTKQLQSIFSRRNEDFIACTSQSQIVYNTNNTKSIESLLVLGAHMQSRVFYLDDETNVFLAESVIDQHYGSENRSKFVTVVLPVYSSLLCFHMLSLAQGMIAQFDRHFSCLAVFRILGPTCMIWVQRRKLVLLEDHCMCKQLINILQITSCNSL